MLKNILILLILSGLIGSVTACSSKKEKEEDGAAAQEISGEVAEGDEFGDAETDDFGSDEGSGDGFADSGESSSGEVAKSDEVSDAADDFGDEGGGGNEDFADDGNFDEGSGAVVEGQGQDELAAGEEPTDIAMDAEPMAEPPAEEPAMDEPTVAEEFSEAAEPMMAEGSSEVGGYQDEPQKTWVSVKKIKDVPYRRSGILVNAVFLARAGNTLSDISQKIYGADKTEELLVVNPWLARGVKTGDKIYYNSPQRPQDDARLLTYYEDAGLQPEIYVTKDGDNIRKVASDLLGDKDSWKEVWATNMDVESKGELAGGLSLRYWADSSVSSAPPAMAQNDIPPAPSLDEMPPAMGDEPPGMNEPSDMAGNEPPPPPPAMNEPPPPPPAMAAIEPPSPPPPPPAPPKARRSAQKDSKAMDEDGGMLANKDQVMFLGVGVILLLLAVVLIIIIRRKKAQRTDMDFSTATHTHIE